MLSYSINEYASILTFLLSEIYPVYITSEVKQFSGSSPLFVAFLSVGGQGCPLFLLMHQALIKAIVAKVEYRSGLKS